MRRETVLTGCTGVEYTSGAYAAFGHRYTQSDTGEGETGMIKKIGLRHEDRSRWERRAPLVPEDVRRLVQEHGFEVIAQPSARRIFPDDVYAAAGAVIEEGITGCDLVMGVREMSAELFRPGGAYMFFSHTLNGQPSAMAMLRRMKELGCTLIDYERIIDERGRQLVFFGRHAGLAGMIDTLCALGQRLKLEGHDTPFAHVKMAHQYADLHAARMAISRIGEELRDRRLPSMLRPMVFGFVGYGNVSKGAQEIFDLLPHREITPPELLAGAAACDTGSDLLKVVFREEHTVRPKDEDSPFILSHFFQHPNRYQSNFSRYLDHLSVLVNCIFWSPASPRLMTKADAARMWKNGRQPRLRVVGDLSCALCGGIEFTIAATDPDAPVFVYEPELDDIAYGVEGHGPVVMSVDSLPCELPAESSEEFSRALMPFMEKLATVDLNAPFEKSGLPAPLKRAVILWRGKLTPDYEFMHDCLRKAASGDSA